MIKAIVISTKEGNYHNTLFYGYLKENGLPITETGNPF